MKNEITEFLADGIKNKNVSPIIIKKHRYRAWEGYIRKIT
jgi:hypothetical protein